MNIGLFGCGSVGSETARYLLNKQDILKTRTRCVPRLRALYTRRAEKAREVGVSEDCITENWRDIVDDASIDCIVELMGDIDFAREVIQTALKNKKHVVTANKALLAHHGAELLQTARSHGVSIAFEASCGGGIPIVRSLTDGLIANDISALYGVLNGTCNFILTEMEEKKIRFQDALEEATKLGLAEADPTLDICGFDSGHKIAILSTLSFNTTIEMDDIPIKGIHEVENVDLFFAKTLGYTMKLIAAAIQNNGFVSVWVHPAFLLCAHPMASVKGAFNAISVVGSETGQTLYLGHGAGGQATTSAVIADIVSIANGSTEKTYSSICMRSDTNTQNLQTTMLPLKTSAYLRLAVDDAVGVLANVATVLKNHSISIQRVLQEDLPHTPTKFQQRESTALIIITHVARWEDIIRACKDCTALKSVRATPIAYPILEL